METPAALPDSPESFRGGRFRDGSTVKNMAAENVWKNRGHRPNRTVAQNAAFDRRLDRASFWEAYVSGYLARQGFWVLHAPIVRSESFDLTTVDLVVSDETASWHQDLEVKGTRDHAMENEVFICSEASFKRKYRQGTVALPVPYVLVADDGSIKYFPMGTSLHLGMHWDRGRHELFPAMMAWVGDRKPVEHLVQHLRERHDQKE